METKYIFIIVMILIIAFVYSFNLTRVLSFKLDNIFKSINKRWWRLMFFVNVFFNNGYIRALIGLSAIGFLLYSLYFMFGTMV